MAIKGITDRVEGKLPVLGYLFPGEGERDECGRMQGGKSLPYFRLALTNAADQELLRDFVRCYGEKPSVVSGVLPYPTLSRNLEAFRIDKRPGVGFLHKCDGEFCEMWVDGKTQEFRSVERGDAPVPCPGGCRPVAFLSLFFPELRRWGVFVFRTYSETTIRHFVEVLTPFAADLLGLSCRLVKVPMRMGFRVLDRASGRMVRRTRELYQARLFIEGHGKGPLLPGRSSTALPPAEADNG